MQVALIFITDFALLTDRLWEEIVEVVLLQITKRLLGLNNMQNIL